MAKSSKRSKGAKGAKGADRQYAAFRRKVKTVRRVARLAAEYVLTDANVSDERVAEVAETHFGGAGDYRGEIFIATVKALTTTGNWKPGLFAPKAEAAAE